jgi:hypothetical protein
MRRGKANRKQPSCNEAAQAVAVGQQDQKKINKNLLHLSTDYVIFLYIWLMSPDWRLDWRNQRRFELHEQCMGIVAYV